MVTDEAVDICDELTRFSAAQAALLTSRGLVYLTDLKLDGGRHGTIVAASHAEAQAIARARGRGERVVGRMAYGFLHGLLQKVRLCA
ncbi:hypothetical protein QA635_24575 [Bradyrhizobium brasilense]|uniref:Uncharacterized protein n=1 Tax=Bradyrhizobium brasilense TaxID=1419277 RepID=A0A1G7HBU3_9BRAD|nr:MULTISPECIES: hypothetical protein [Bradyrhizobium]MCA6096821.1 hypothetical protein [Bradyrhizobium australafricanum]MCC8974665.1 hypothetical protein [Bradyrhizobium brasilense]WFU29776.1 hypothetical protein QA635_24575 [Bradyrhizobium australafricanum]WFU60832.1 hypothetical protein QA636_25170 [Bradyrhizobium brasilense]SDE97868.1 hypothetical protein SAMN05216337_104144 [Bradyrhizobium brasilense]